MSKGVIVSGYQISNALIAALLIASTAGAGVATDSFSGITDGLDIPLSGPSDNVTQNDAQGPDDSNNNQQDGQNSDDSDTENSGDNGSPGSNSDSESGADSGSDSSDDPTDVSDDNNDSVVDEVNDTQDQENDTVTSPVNDTEDSVDDNVTEPVDGNQSDGSEIVAEVPAIYSPKPESAPDSTYETLSIPLEVVLTATSANYSISLDGSTEMTGTVSGTKNVTSTLSLGSAGSHTLKAELTSSGEVLQSATRTFSIAQSAEDTTKTGFYLTENLTAEQSTVIRLYDNGSAVQGQTVYLDGSSIGRTNQYGKVQFTVPNKQEITISSSSPDYQQTYTVEGYEEVNTPLVYSASIQNPSSGQKLQTPFTFEASVDAGLADSYEIKNRTHVLASGSLTENSTNVISRTIEQDFGSLSLELVVLNSENDNTTSKSVSADITGYKHLNVFSPSRGAVLDTYQPQFYFEINNSYYNADKVKVISNSEIIHQETLTDTRVEIGGQGVIEDIVPKGQNQWKVQLVNGREEELGAFDYETLRSPPSTIQLSEVKPEDKATVAGTTVEFNYTIATPKLDDNYYAIQSTSDGYGLGSPNNERLVREGNQSYSLTHQFPSSGDYQWKLWIQNNRTGNNVTSITRNITVNQQ